MAKIAIIGHGDVDAPSSVASRRYRGNDRLVLGIVLSVITFWLFAQTTLNVAPAMRKDLQITESVSNIVGRLGSQRALRGLPWWRSR